MSHQQRIEKKQQQYFRNITEYIRIVIQIKYRLLISLKYVFILDTEMTTVSSIMLQVFVYLISFH